MQQKTQNQTIENQLYLNFINSFTELVKYQEHQIPQIQSSQLVIPIIYQTIIPNTYIVYIGPTQNHLQLPSTQLFQPDLLQQIPTILFPSIQPQKLNVIEQIISSDNENKSQQRSIEKIIPEKTSLFEIKKIHRELQAEFPKAPKCPQLTVTQIMNLTQTQLENVIGLIDENELPEDQRTIFSRLKLSIAYKNQNPKKIAQSDNKNIPKNFTKAMFTYAMTHKEILRKVLEKSRIQDQEEQFIEWLRENKKNIHNTKQLRTLNQSIHEYVNPFKLMQQHFLKHNSVCYIFNSRIENTPAHLKAKLSIKETVFSDQTI